LAFAPPRTTEEICSAAAPELVTVTVCGPFDVPSVIVENETLAGMKDTAGFVDGGEEAVPLS
jgi:hypothetical protein